MDRIYGDPFCWARGEFSLDVPNYFVLCNKKLDISTELNNIKEFELKMEFNEGRDRLRIYKLQKKSLIVSASIPQNENIKADEKKRYSIKDKNSSSEQNEAESPDSIEKFDKDQMAMMSMSDLRRLCKYRYHVSSFNILTNLDTLNTQ